MGIVTGYGIRVDVLFPRWTGFFVVFFRQLIDYRFGKVLFEAGFEKAEFTGIGFFEFDPQIITSR